MDKLKTFERLESEVRGYSRSFPAVFEKARGAFLFDEEGREYIDFLCGAGTLNYGHNNPILKRKVIEYLLGDGLIHGLDMASTAKRRFLETFEAAILWPRGLKYKIQFPGPTGTNAVEAALKLARKVTGRTTVVSFTNGFHGVSLGSLAATGNTFFREGAGVALNQTAFMPYDGYLGEGVDTLEYFRRFLADQSSGLDHPAAVIVETVQGEGGVNVASFEWLRGLERLCREFDVLLIVDDIQMGCGRTGAFFSFEEAGLKPDMVTLSKSLSAYGLPLSALLIRPDLDLWRPGEHSGTFRGNNLALVAATEALNHYWCDGDFSRRVCQKARLLRERLERIVERYPEAVSVRGRGLVQGLVCAVPEQGKQISRAAFEKGLIVETSGAEGQVVKLLPPLVIEESKLKDGLEILEQSVSEVLEQSATPEQAWASETEAAGV
ncbi:MAG: diaminobutyrate--2-oxoglutarate transaminase [Candidatus Handelsmanbacteria bacterium RIFCSPLOWO2_12_FULL_64_10]|uniref:Diaminobutyrate--2-oxoglutarate transaminase n=1 Tax=Handelsmanbacteria sp. (strain RIFCSPLOWO2_12_FULL_64_10) TaxID=1817868 RepID=A0A1F6D401_HANXR|nr:MAG: diaminobutyrate--2-oxoglutarate transaminase [Candidatus Handelsmanbacteria bacterium RIFCSPLOWO2_12_FULL_64_10]